MSTLLLRLAAPLMAWGTDSKFEVRRTDREPSKSAVTGLLAAALGRRRGEDMSDLSTLRFGVRTDREGALVRDYHTAHGIVKGKEESYVTTRYYLSDAVFLCGLEGEESRLRDLADALRHPRFPLFLGRRSCPPTLPVLMGIRPLPLEEALLKEPLLVRDRETAGQILCEPRPGEQLSARRRDLVMSFNPADREYAWRGVKLVRPAVKAAEPSEPGEHDAFSALEEAEEEGGSYGSLAF